ncbi:MAG: hypothetical protein U0802_18735 [Candidatus Binatia bacterium]
MRADPGCHPQRLMGSRRWAPPPSPRHSCIPLGVDEQRVDAAVAVDVGGVQLPRLALQRVPLWSLPRRGGDVGAPGRASATAAMISAMSTVPSASRRRRRT